MPTFRLLPQAAQIGGSWHTGGHEPLLSAGMVRYHNITSHIYNYAILCTFKLHIRIIYILYHNMNDCKILIYIENNCKIMIMLISLVYQCLVISHHVSNHLSITAPGMNRYAACTTPNRNSWPRLSENGATKKIRLFISLSHILMTINGYKWGYTELYEPKTHQTGLFLGI